jgi:hypothetical protein
MLNVRAESVTQLVGLLDSLFGEGTGAELVAKFFVTQAFAPQPPVPASLSQTSGGARSGDQPSEKQIAFAGKLGIQGAAGMSKRELSAAIDAKTKK